MKREDLRNMGISEENIEKIMADFGKETQKANKASALQNDLDAAKASAEELQKQLDAINEAKLSDIEKANKETEKANIRIAELEGKIALTQKLKDLADIGIVGEQATNLFDEKGNLNYANLGQIISSREEAAKNATIQEIASKQGNPGGGSSDDETRTSAEIIASKMFGNKNEGSNNVISNYI